MNIQRYSAADLPTLFDKISKNSIGMDEYFDSFWNASPSNYPPYNLIHESNVLSRLEIALAAFKRDEVKVYTEYGKLIVESEKEESEETDPRREEFHEAIKVLGARFDTVSFSDFSAK